MVADAKTLLSPADYLEFEAKSSIKHDYIDGEVVELAGTTDVHNTIFLNLATLIRPCLRGSNCRLYAADIKARIEARNCFYYPDLLVTCDPRDQETSTYKRFPCLIIEVLSEGTEAFDRGNKFNDYQALETLEDYLLVNTQSQRIEHFHREAKGWFLQTYTQGSFTLSGLDITLDVSSIYEDVILEAKPRNPEFNLKTSSQ